VFSEGGDPDLVIHDEGIFFGRLARDGALGFGESYLVMAWECGRSPEVGGTSSDELTAWLAVYGKHLGARESTLLHRARSLWYSAHPISEENSRSGAAANVAAHYDIDPRLFALFLDDSMTYSSAWFEEGDDLESAQRRKIDAILDTARVRRGCAVLDIGSGFGALAIRAARERGAGVVGLTLSARQREHATSLARREGLDDRVSFLVEDYRQHSGVYDSIVSVEMMEAVGAAYWREYLLSVERLLRPGGYFALQVITFPHRKMLISRRDFSWVHRYVFPGGALPSVRVIHQIVGSTRSLEIVESRRLTDSYARTLREWRHRFAAAVPAIRELGFDATFCRLWNLYFAYFEAAFLSRYCDVWQFGVRKRVSS
jgi:cyclopropane-fatty-acyl-phospholipid synthase